MQSIQNTASILSVFEHQVVSKHNFISDDFHWLLAKIEADDLTCFRLAIKSGQIVLIVGHYLSVIKLPSGTILEILPKISKPKAVNNKNTNNSTGVFTSSHDNSKKSINNDINNTNINNNNIDDTRINEITSTRVWVAQMLTTTYGIKSQQLPLVAQSKVTEYSSDKSNNPDNDDFSNNQQIYHSWINPIVEYWLMIVHNLEFPRNYNRQYINQPQSRGKLVIKQQLKHNIHRPHYQYSSQDNLDLNPLWGQFFYTVLLQLTSLNVPLKSDMSISQIIHQLSIKCRDNTQSNQINSSSFQSLSVGVWQNSYNQLKKILNQSQSQHNTQHHEKLSTALRIGWYILKNSNIHTAIPTIGNEITGSVMINMNQAFEKWVIKALQKQYGDSVQSQPKSLWLKGADFKNYKLLEAQPDKSNVNKSNVNKSNVNKSVKEIRINEKGRYLQPDVIIKNLPEDHLAFNDSFSTVTISKSHDEYAGFNTKDIIRQRNNVVSVVADVKYKTISCAADVKPADLYQLFTYCEHWQAKQAWLIFPKNDDFTKPILLKSKKINGFTILLIPFDVKSESLIMN